MNKLVCRLILIAALLPSPVLADVTMEMATTDAQGRQAEDNVIFARSGRIRIDNVGGAPGHMSMIFRGSDLVMLNHDEKTYYVIDEATLQHIGSKMSEASRMMDEQMKNMPPDQRAMMEKMMQGRMQGMQGMQGRMPGMGTPQGQEEEEPLRFEANGQSEWQSYSCNQYKVYDGGVNIQEICAVSMDQIDGAEEMTDAFHQMAAFMKKMTGTFKAGPFAQAGKTPMDMMQEIDGFPVVTRHLENGKTASETFLKSVNSKKLDPALFEPPRGYKLQDLTR